MACPFRHNPQKDSSEGRCVQNRHVCTRGLLFTSRAQDAQFNVHPCWAAPVLSSGELVGSAVLGIYVTVASHVGRVTSPYTYHVFSHLPKGNSTCLRPLIKSKEGKASVKPLSDTSVYFYT